MLASSATASKTTGDFLIRRVCRIHPACVVAYLLSVYLFGPFLASNIPSIPSEHYASLVLLQPPPVPAGPTVGSPWPELNGALWTISYEFRCYLFLVLFRLTGLLRHPRAVALLGGCLLVSVVLTTFGIGPSLDTPPSSGLVFLAVGHPFHMLRFFAAFVVGISASAWWGALSPGITTARAACFGLAALLASRNLHFGDVSLILFGAPFLFWFACKASLGWLQRINRDWDISYGLYLYGWPVAKLLLLRNPGISPAVLSLSTLPLAATLGYASWWLLEQRAVAAGRKWGRLHSERLHSEHLYSEQCHGDIIDRARSGK